MGVGYFESLFPIGSVRGGGKGMEGSEARQWQEPVVKKVFTSLWPEKRDWGPNVSFKEISQWTNFLWGLIGLALQQQHRLGTKSSTPDSLRTFKLQATTVFKWLGIMVNGGFLVSPVHASESTEWRTSQQLCGSRAHLCGLLQECKAPKTAGSLPAFALTAGTPGSTLGGGLPENRVHLRLAFKTVISFPMNIDWKVDKHTKESRLANSSASASFSLLSVCVGGAEVKGWKRTV